MNSTDEIRKHVYDKDMLIRMLDVVPHTYKTFLGSSGYSDGTLQFVLRTKLNSLHKDGDIAKCLIPGTRFGMVIFYSFKKCYNVVIESNRVGINVFYFYDYVKISKFYIRVYQYYTLNDFEWVENNEKRDFFQGNFLRWI